MIDQILESRTTSIMISAFPTNPFTGKNKGLVAVLALVVLVMAALGFWVLDRAMQNSALSKAQTLSENDAAILAEGLQSELEKFSLVPLVLAEDPEVQALLAGRNASPAVLNRRLEQLVIQTGAAAIYLTNTDGTALAASNWRFPTSFVGSNYAFRRYFITAMQQGRATQFALGTVSQRPGLYIARRATDGDGTVLGVVTIKVEFDALEASWARATAGVFVTDQEGVVLVTSNPAWRFRTTHPLSQSARDHDADRLQFGMSPLKPLPVLVNNGAVLGTSLVEVRQSIAANGWELHLLHDAKPLQVAARTNARLTALLALALVALICGAAFILAHRRKRIDEERLMERTAVLREQLHQANRLATLGQITAGIGHELRQPVAAIRAYAEAGEKLIVQGDTPSAQGSLGKIIALTHRIGKITDEFLRFSRRTPPTPRSVTLGEVIEGALLLLDDRIRQLKISIHLPDPEAMQTVVRGDHIGLEQVLVDLIQNAIDATGAGGRVVLDILCQQNTCRLTVSDNGPGLTEDQRASLFQPFATTKADGLGLGLVISLDIMRGLGGRLMADTSSSGGSFTMEIPLA